jgi:hypothetical protein
MMYKKLENLGYDVPSSFKREFSDLATARGRAQWCALLSSLYKSPWVFAHLSILRSRLRCSYGAVHTAIMYFTVDRSYPTAPSHC